MLVFGKFTSNSKSFTFKSSVRGNHLFGTFAKFSEETNTAYPIIRTRTCAYEGVRNVSFVSISE